MAKISLRQYNRDVESLIEHGQTEEAIAHCKHILQVYPKYIDAYRLLGKAYLESERYTQAADLFQRVLACLPDDMVSHIGMSLIREAEEDLDAAIAHMERAYDLQPSNQAVQEELRRLYGVRDRVEPARVRLTRGALIRMYARGNLYQQAIAEIRYILKEEPERYDLRVLLARMYWLSGMKVEAAEACTALLNQYPFCIDANRILAEILPETSRAEDAQSFLERVQALDPYTQFISPASPTVADVPDQSVMIDRQLWHPGLQETPAQTSQTSGFDQITESQPVTQAPEWLLPELKAPADFDTQTAEEIIDVEEENEQEGIKAVSGHDTAVNGSTTPFNLTGVEASPEAREGLIPDWMKGAGWTLGTGEVDEADVFSRDDAAEEDVEPGEVFTADLPDWIQSLAPKPPAEAGSEKTGGALDLPAALDHGNVGLTDLKSDELLQDIPDWLNPVLNVGMEATPLPEIAEDTPQITPTSPEDATIAIQDETSAWLESLAAMYGSENETLIARPEDRLKQPPAWIHGIPGDDTESKTETYGDQGQGTPVDRQEEIISDGVRTETPDIFPAWTEDTTTDEESGYRPPSLSQITEGWKLEFSAVQESEAGQAQSTSENQEIEDFAEGIHATAKPSEVDTATDLLTPTAAVEVDQGDETDVERLVEEALPAWIDSLDLEPTSQTVDDAREPEPFSLSKTDGDGTIPQDGREVTVNEDEAILEQARNDLMEGNVSQAVEVYNQLIESDNLVDVSIQDLQQALYRYPVDPSLWETLGNAYARNNQLQEALDAYTKAEELIR